MAARQKNDRVTIRTVAEDAGVSAAAVSKVLRDAYGVSDALRARVQASMQKLGYRPHAAARGMRGQTYTLGVILPDIHNPFFTDSLGSELGARAHPIPDTVRHRAIQHRHGTVAHRGDDGPANGRHLFIGPRIGQGGIEAAAKRIPMAVIAHHVRVASYDTVNDDDALGGMLVVQHLVEQGYRNIAMLSLETGRPDDRTTVTAQREIGYRRAMQEAGLKRYIKVAAAEQTSRDVQVAARHLLERRSRPEAIFCWTDFIALEVLSVARELRLSVPGDLAVVGYDNTGYCDLAQNSLTSIDQSGQVLGLQAARLLIERIKGHADEHLVVTPRLVARASSTRRH